MSPRPRPEPGLLVLSPHLDDAVLSCAGLLGTLPPGVRVTVATFFTEATAAPVTRAARSFLRQAGWAGDPEAFYRVRRREDREAVSRLGAVCEHAGLVDALFRSREGGPFRGAAGDRLARVLRRVLPELTYRYPSYRFDIGLGRVSRGDRGVRRDLTSQVIRMLDDLDPVAVLAPLAIGRHVDHLLVRDAAVTASRCRPGPVPAFYADLPYALQQRPDPGFVARTGLRRAEYPHGAELRATLVGLYRTQAAALFPDGVPTVPDEYWWPAGQDADLVLARLLSPPVPAPVERHGGIPAQDT